MSKDRWGGYERYPKTQRRVAADGIKSRTSTFGKAWWSRHWIDVLKTFGWDNRLTRGRSYARSGQVLDYTVTAGAVTARVQGSRPKPYNVRIAMKSLSDATWEKVFDALAARAEYAAHLLNGEMPQDIDEVFKTADASLLPARTSDLTMECSCPDWANPCKHVAAVHYILAEALDGEPFILTSLRGRTREQVLGSLRQRRGQAEQAAVAEAAAPAMEPLIAEGFWGRRADLSALDMGFTPPPTRGSLLRRLGTPGPWATVEEMTAVFGPALRAASDEALRAGNLQSGVG